MQQKIYQLVFVALGVLITYLKFAKIGRSCPLHPLGALRYKCGLYFEPTEKVIEKIIVDLDEFIHFANIHEGQKISIN